MKSVTVKNLVLGQGMPKICIPITGENRETIEKEMEEILELKPDLAEWRVDCYKKGSSDESIWEMLETISDKLGEIPLLFTFRTRREGGAQEIMYEDYVKLLLQAAKTGRADLIDVELFFRREEAEMLIRNIHQAGALVLASNHHFHETPDAEELIARMKEMDACGADILKMAVMPETETDLCPLLKATLCVSEDCEKPVVTMSMGKTGVLSRLWGEFTGSCITFAAGQKASAPGQVDAHKMREALEVLHEIAEK